MSLLFYLHFLLPLMSVFMGTAVIADEVDERTLPYLLVRPVSRRDVVLSKIISNTLTLGILLFVSLFLSYSLMAVEGGIGSWVKNMSVFLQSGGVLCLGALVYTPLFACLGGLIKRPVLVGLFFMIGWENTIGSFPGNIKLITIVHYLHVLFPPLQKYNFINLVLPTKQVSDITAILILLFLAALFTGLSMSLLYVREYRLEQS